MSLGEVIQFRDGSYDVRAIVDNRYVIRLRNRKTGTETYEIWTSEQRDEFDRNQSRTVDLEDRACQIYERHLGKETYANLGREYGISKERVRQICVRQARKAKAAKG
jgi:DNA-directed RNA polymerase sigma subunit (sigma70/sigma32)